MGVRGRRGRWGEAELQDQGSQGGPVLTVGGGVRGILDTGQVAVESRLFCGCYADLLIFKAGGRAVLGRGVQAQVTVRSQNVGPTQSIAELVLWLWEQAEKAKSSWLDLRASLMDDLHCLRVFVCVYACLCTRISVYVCLWLSV